MWDESELRSGEAYARATYARWRLEWRAGDIAAAMLDLLTPAEFRQALADHDLSRSHAKTLAARSEAVPRDDRDPSTAPIVQATRERLERGA